MSRLYSVNGLNQYLSAGPASFSYDSNGNLTSDGSVNYGFDAENRLISASGARSAALVYDPLGRLHSTSGGSAGETRFLYDGDELIAEYDGAGTLLRRYVHGPLADDPMVWYEGASVAAAARRQMFTDHQGSVVAVADSVGALLRANSYDDWGTPGATNLGRFGYTGQAWIPEIGLFHYKARAYSPTLGRFLQTDPIGYDDQVNLYAYVGNDPVDNTDPSGRDPGDVYSSIYDAAVAAAKQYVPESSNENREFGGFFYTVKGGFSYTSPWKGDMDSVGIPSGCWFKNCIEGWHTHGFPDPHYDNENFSGLDGDKGWAESNGKPLWLFTPSGWLKRYDPKSNKTTRSRKRIRKFDSSSNKNSQRSGGRPDPRIKIDTPQDVCRWKGNCIGILEK